MNTENNGNVLSLASFVSADASSDRTVWVEFKGVRFNVRYVSRQAIRLLGERCVIQTIEAGRGRIPKVDHAKFTAELASLILVGWERLTFSSIQNLMVLQGGERLTPEQLNLPVPFTPENVILLLQNASGLDEALQEIASDPSAFRSVPKETLAKNSESSASGT